MNSEQSRRAGPRWNSFVLAAAAVVYVAQFVLAALQHRVAKNWTILSDSSPWLYSRVFTDGALLGLLGVLLLVGVLVATVVRKSRASMVCAVGMLALGIVNASTGPFSEARGHLRTDDLGGLVVVVVLDLLILAGLALVSVRDRHLRYAAAAA